MHFINYVVIFLTISLTLGTTEDIVTIGLLFFSEDMNFKNIEEKRNQLKESLSSAIGEATVLVVEKEEQIEAKKDQFSEYQLVESDLSFGKLYHFFSEERGYYFCLSSEKDPVINFILEELPLFDSSLQSLDKKVKFFQDQRQLMENERTETDKFVSKLLYQGIGKKDTDLERIDVLENEIDDLSSAYEKIANYVYMINNAQNTIENEIRKVSNCLSSFCLEKPLASEYIKDSKEFFDHLELEKGLLNNSLAGIKTAIDVVDTKVGLLRGKESLSLQQQTQKLQEEGTSMQMATSMIEFILVFYYSLASWEHLASPEVFHLIPVVLQATLIGAFSFMAVVCTHYLAISWRENWKINKGVLISLTIIIALVISIILITQYYAHLPSTHH